MTIELFTINNFMTIFQIWIQARYKEIKIVIVEGAKIQKNKKNFHCIFSKLNASFAFLGQKLPYLLETF